MTPATPTLMHRRQTLLAPCPLSPRSLARYWSSPFWAGGMALLGW